MNPQGLRDKTIRWMAQIIGQLQRRIKDLEKENARMRSQIKRNQEFRAKAAGAGQ